MSIIGIISIVMIFALFAMAITFWNICEYRYNNCKLCGKKTVSSSNSEKWCSKCMTLIQTMKIFGIIACVSFLMSCFSNIGTLCVEPISSEYISVSTQELVAFADDSQINSVSRSRVNERMYFVFYYKTNNGYKFDKVKSDNATIIESDTEISRVEIGYTKYKYNWYEYVYAPSTVGNTIKRTNEIIKIYVPVGTIIKDFEGDLQ